MPGLLICPSRWIVRERDPVWLYYSVLQGVMWLPRHSQAPERPPLSLWPFWRRSTCVSPNVRPSSWPPLVSWLSRSEISLFVYFSWLLLNTGMGDPVQKYWILYFKEGESPFFLFISIPYAVLILTFRIATNCCSCSCEVNCISCCVLIFASCIHFIFFRSRRWCWPLETTWMPSAMPALVALWYARTCVNWKVVSTSWWGLQAVSMTWSIAVLLVCCLIGYSAFRILYMECLFLILLVTRYLLIHKTANCD